MSATLIDEHAAAEMLGLSVKTLQRWRWAGRELPYVKLGNAVRYDVADLETYISTHRKRVKEQSGAA